MKNSELSLLHSKGNPQLWAQRNFLFLINSSAEDILVQLILRRKRKINTLYSPLARALTGMEEGKAQFPASINISLFLQNITWEESDKKNYPIE